MSVNLVWEVCGLLSINSENGLLFYEKQILKLPRGKCSVPSYQVTGKSSLHKLFVLLNRCLVNFSLFQTQTPVQSGFLWRMYYTRRLYHLLFKHGSTQIPLVQKWLLSVHRPPLPWLRGTPTALQEVSGKFELNNFSWRGKSGVQSNNKYRGWGVSQYVRISKSSSSHSGHSTLGNIVLQSKLKGKVFSW